MLTGCCFGRWVKAVLMESVNRVLKERPRNAREVTRRMRCTNTLEGECRLAEILEDWRSRVFEGLLEDR